ncbi:MAG: hypothetical protein V4688_07425 [Pseudomonadota bacterium]
MHEAALVKFTRFEDSGEHTISLDPGLSYGEKTILVIERLMAVFEPDNILITLGADQIRGTRAPIKDETPTQIAVRLGFSQLSYEINGVTHIVLS